MNAIEIIQELDAMSPATDPENGHSRADDLLLEFLKNHDPASKDVAEAWERARDRVGFWYA
jgi:hypothetical protein